MKELKRGDFVWSKEYGNGLVYAGWADTTYEVLFENQSLRTISARSDLFAKGDEVEPIVCWGNTGELVGIFIGITDDPKDDKLIIKVNKDMYIYVNDFKHKPIDKLEIILTLNGKEIDVKTISRETWDNIRC